MPIEAGSTPPGRPRPSPIAFLVATLAVVAALAVMAGIQPPPDQDVGPEGPIASVDPISSSTSAPVPSSTVPSTTVPTTVGEESGTVSDDPEQLELTPGWEDLGRLPEPRYHAEVLDTGHELVIFGGTRDRFTTPTEPGFDPMWSGIAIDHATRRVGRLPDPPMCGSGTPVARWTGDELVVWAVAALVLEDCPPAAAYSPERDTWRVLDSGFFREAGSQTVWTGDELLSATAGLAYRLGTGEVREVTSVRESSMFTGTRIFSPPRVHWTGSEVLALGAEGVIRLDPDTGRLDEGPAPPIPSRARSSVWTGDRLLAINYDLEAALFDPSRGSWEPISSLPLRFYECLPEPTAVSGLAFVGWCSGIGVWDGSGDWKLLPRPALEGDASGELVAAGGHLYQVGRRVVRYPIPDIVDGEMAQPDFLPLGVQYLSVPEGWEITHTHGDLGTDPGTGTREAIGVDLRGPEGTTCQAVSTYQGMNRYLPTPTEPAELTRRHDGHTIPVGQAAAGPEGKAYVVIADANGSDILHVACPDLDTARFVAAHLWSPRDPPDRLPPGVSGDRICDIELTVDADEGTEETRIVVQLRLAEATSCDLDHRLGLRLSLPEGAGPAGVVGSPAWTPLQHVLAPDEPYLAAVFAWRNWCDDDTVLAGVVLGDAAQAFARSVGAACLEPGEPSTLELVDIDGPRRGPFIEG